MDTKRLTFIIMMGALGNSLFLISLALVGYIGQNIALDFSLLAVFIAGIYAGPKAGFATGLIAGIIPGIMLGPAGNGAFIALLALPLGKGLTGLTIGLLVANLKLNNRLHKALLCIPLVLLAYVPEGLFTYVYLIALLPLFLNSAPMASVIVNGIMIKAIIEVAIMSLIMAFLLSNKAVDNFIGAYFYRPKIKPV
ncbi:MAG: hypothetical protein LBI79_05310 [Nitrososphaerota archaeon]|nr:hypothetical protein [Nitrososphaerota archaeon]